MTAAVITISDGVAAGEREDESGRLLVDLLESEGYSVAHRVVPDDRPQIAAAIRDKSGKAVAAISMPGPTSRVIGRNPDLVGKMLQSYANQASRQLGFTANLR